jgi:hypothetical protein
VGNKNEYKYCPHCGAEPLEYVDEKMLQEENRKKYEKETKEKLLSEITSMFHNKKYLYLFMKGWEISTQSEMPSLKGIKTVKTDIVLKDRCTIAMIAEGELDTENKLAEYPLEYIEIAKNLGAETIIVMQKDYPCIGRLPDHKFIIIAPRVSGD